MNDWDPRANEIFLRAVDAASPADRAACLDEACGGDAGLRGRVEALLAAHAATGGFLESPPAQAATVLAEVAAIAEGPGTVIGPYKLLQRIGEGGFGVVFMAEQERPVRRKVALKVIKPGMDTREVVARFEAERQALALMDHPNIAKVLDGGSTASGRPYFVMELVRGVPITRYCDEHHLTPKQRLDLFVPVCRAVQHAHAKGVIHRDLKPTNVLVALYDGRPVPKVIDFGIAKATGGRLTDKTLFTGFGSVVGTLEYMSPEQAEMNQLDVDTRSDVYSLGVLLYELMTGSTPIDRGRLGKAGLAEALRLIREEDPPAPSTRLSTAATLPSIAASRGVEPARLGRLVRGDLDRVVMKALEKDRNRRYETATALARDVERYLADEPVEAAPAGRLYRMRRVARRHKGALAAAAAVLAAVLFGAGVATWQAVRADDARALAEKRLDSERKARREADDARAAAVADRQAALAAERRAREEAGKARSVADLLTRMVASAAPATGVATDDDTRKMLDELVERARTDGTTRDSAWRWYLLAMTRLSVGDAEGAHRVAREMFELFKGTEDPEIAQRVLYTCVSVPFDFADAVATERLCELALEAEYGYPLERLVGAVRYRQGRFREAIELIEQADVGRGWDYAFLAMAHDGLADFQEARRYLGKADEWVDSSPPDHRLGWWEQHEVATLRAEAEELISGAGRATSDVLDELVARARALPFADETDRVLMWRKLAATPLRLGDAEGSGRVARKLFDHYVETQNPMVAARVLSACVVTGDGLGDDAAADRLCALALRWKGTMPDDFSYDDYVIHPWDADWANEGYPSLPRGAVGAVRYRQGRFREAIDLLEVDAIDHAARAIPQTGHLARTLPAYGGRLPDRFPDELDPDLFVALVEYGANSPWRPKRQVFEDTLFLAMARQALGDPRGARGYLATVKGWIEDYEVRGISWGVSANAEWWELKEIAALLAEAERLIGPVERLGCPIYDGPVEARRP